MLEVVIGLRRLPLTLSSEGGHWAAIRWVKRGERGKIGETVRGMVMRMLWGVEDGKRGGGAWPHQDAWMCTLAFLHPWFVSQTNAGSSLATYECDHVLCKG